MQWPAPALCVTHPVATCRLPGIMPQPIPSYAYDASKAAVHMLTKKLSTELADRTAQGGHGITVNAIAPGAFLTEMPLTKLPPATIEAIATKVPNRRWGQPHELVGPILMLVSDAGAYVNGATLRVDGGLLSRAY